jgi:hypothetical protein
MNYLSVSSYNCYQPASEVMDIMAGTSAILTALIFIFLIIFSAKTQLTSLMERFREVGILKSLGWSNSRLSRQILLISLFQSLAGTALGVLFGFALISLLNSYDIKIFRTMEFQFQSGAIPVLLLMPLAGGLIAGIFPIIKLCRAKAGYPRLFTHPASARPCSRTSTFASRYSAAGSILHLHYYQGRYPPRHCQPIRRNRRGNHRG